MAFTATAAPGEYHVLVEFVLDSTTLRYADEDLSIQSSNTVGHFYEGRLSRAGTIRRQLNSVLEPRERIETWDCVLDNRDLALAQLINVCTFANRDVNVWLGQGITKGSYSNVFPAAVVHPNGITWDEDEAVITVADRRLKDRRILPLAVYTTASFANLEPRSVGVPQPIWYGDWRYNSGTQLAIPANCVNTLTQTFRVAGHKVGQIQRVLKNAVALNLTTQVSGISLSTSQFSLVGQTYNACTDIISVNGRGFVTANASTIERPAETLKHLQTYWCGVSSSAQNGTAYHTVDGQVSFSVARHIAEQDSTETYTGELLNENNIDLRFVAGQYAPRWRILDLEADRVDFYENDILHDDTEKADFRVEYDPERYYCNQVRARGAWDPVDERYTQTNTANMTTEQRVIGATVTREWDLHWLYDPDLIAERIGNEVAMYGNNPMTVNVGLGGRALMKNLADQIDLTYSILTQRPLSLRYIETNLVDMTVKARGDDVYYLGGVGRWAGDSAVSYATAPSGDIGYWCNSVGYIVTGSPGTANRSRWY